MLTEYQRGYNNGVEDAMRIADPNYNPNFIKRDMGVERYSETFTFPWQSEGDRSVFWSYVEDELKSLKKASEIKHWKFYYSMEERRTMINQFNISLSLLWDNKNEALDKAIQNLLLRVAALAPYEPPKQPKP